MTAVLIKRGHVGTETHKGHVRREDWRAASPSHKAPEIAVATEARRKAWGR